MHTLSAKAVPSHRFLSLVLNLALVTLALTPLTLAQNARKQVEGVTNFGQVTERYYRGGSVTPAGVENLAAMGVRTIIDLRDKPNSGEPEACKRNGIKYYKFPMDGSVTPDDKAVNEILSIIQNAREPVYVHCSAGKHRAGTIAALYRIRVQGWPKEKAWTEQQSYGFGSASEHSELYAYVYGRNAKSESPLVARAATTGESQGKIIDSAADSDSDEAEPSRGSQKEEKLSKSKSKKKDYADDKESKRKEEKLAKSKRKDDDDSKKKDHSSKHKDKDKKKDKDKSADVVAAPAEN